MNSTPSLSIIRRLFLALFASLATFFIINVTIQICGALIDAIQRAKPIELMPSVGCLASIEMCNLGASEAGMHQSLFADLYAGPCTQCNPEVTTFVYLLQILILILPAGFVFWKSGTRSFPATFNRRIRLILSILFFICLAYAFINLAPVFFGP